MSNVPDDWGMYVYNCMICGSRYHMSEGGCGCTEDKDLCHGHNCGDSTNRDHYHEETRTLGDGKTYCEDCLECECCQDDGKTDPTIHYSEDHGLLLCKTCDTGDGCATRCVKATTNA